MSTTATAPTARAKRTTKPPKKHVLVLDPKLSTLRDTIRERLDTLPDPDPKTFAKGDDDEAYLAALDEIDAEADLIDHLASLPAGISLGLGVLAHCSVNRWEDLLSRMASEDGPTVKKLGTLALTSWQEILLSEYDKELRLIHRTKPSVSIASCPVCGMYVLVSGTSPARPARTSILSGNRRKQRLSSTRCSMRRPCGCRRTTRTSGPSSSSWKTGRRWHASTSRAPGSCT